MRYALLLLLVPTLLATGCAAVIARVGIDPYSFETRAGVRKRLGEPTLTTTDEDGDAIEEYRSRRKYAEPLRSHYCVLGFIMTWGVGEFIQSPVEVGKLARRILIGQTLRFTFSPDGSIRSVKIDGYTNELPGQRKVRSDEPDPKSDTPHP